MINHLQIYCESTAKLDFSLKRPLGPVGGGFAAMVKRRSPIGTLSSWVLPRSPLIGRSMKYERGNSLVVIIVIDDDCIDIDIAVLTSDGPDYDP
jgi:hypothetical protein